MNNTLAWKNFKSTIAAPIDPWLFFAMLAIYIMSLFLLYSA
ncbi:rod shape-determining protein RodA, partial [Neisseria sp. P0016.S002]